MKYLTKSNLDLQLLTLLQEQKQYINDTIPWHRLEGAIKVIETLAKAMEYV